MIDEEKGVKISTRFENGKFFPECFVGKKKTLLLIFETDFLQTSF